jgi:aspartate/methionine/tyrosine aminotransferase
MAYSEPWSKRHKKVTGGLPFSLSNSFAEPLNNEELINMALRQGDGALVEAYRKHSLEYTPNGGSEDLREEVANFYGPDITAENIIIFPGAQAALQTAAIALIAKGEEDNCHAIVFSPGYQSVQSAPLHAGGAITSIPLYPENGWAIDLKDVEAAIQANTKYIIINEPYNPAGTLMKPKVQAGLRDIAKKHGLYILSDEVYRLLEHDEKDRLPAMADFYDKGISACTLSKPWGACGVTIGWLALQDQGLKQKIIDTQYFGTACPSRASELQALMVLRASDEILAKNIAIIHHNMGLLDAFFESYDDLFSWFRPNAGAICFVKFKGPLTSEELGQKLADAGISIKPAYVFGEENPNYSIDYYQDYFRLGYGEAKMPAALEALISFVEKNKKKWRKEMATL